MERGHPPHIIVALDPTKQPRDPLSLGVRMARRMGVPMALVTVLPSDPLLPGYEGPELTEARDSTRQKLLELGRTLDDVEIADAAALVSSSPGRALHELSESTGTAAIVVGSTTRGPLRRLMPGTVAQQLLSGAACPVAVAPHGYADQERGDLSLVAVAYDGSDEAKLALDAARELARRARARLRVITAVARLAFGTVPVSAIEPATSASRAMEQELRDLHDAATSATSELDTESVFREGDAVDVLVEASSDADLLVTGSRGYGPLGAVLLGSTTRRLTEAVSCPLLMLPRGRGLDLGDAR